VEVKLYAVLTLEPDEIKINIPEFNWDLNTGHTDIESTT
jgi:hypothetical protein